MNRDTSPYKQSRAATTFHGVSLDLAMAVYREVQIFAATQNHEEPAAKPSPTSQQQQLKLSL
jgi:hypothetical protein